MRKIPLFERIMLLIGILLLFLGLISLLNFNRIATLLGFDASSDRKIVARTEAVQQTVRRKIYDAPEFTPLSEQQSIFSGDVVTTGSNSHAVIAFASGAFIEIEPDSSIEFQVVDGNGGLDDQSIILDLLKGKVKGNSGEGLVKLRKNGVVAEIPHAEPVRLAASPTLTPLPSPTPMPTAAVVATPKPECSLAQKSIEPPSGAMGLPLVTLEVLCPDRQNSKIVVMNGREQVIGEFNVTFDSQTFDSQSKGKFVYAPKIAGVYQFSMKEGTTRLRVEVPRLYQTAEWSTLVPSCEGVLEGKNYSSPLAQSQLLDSKGATVWKRDGSNLLRTDPLSEKVRLPATLKMKYVLKSGYEVSTPALLLTQWRDCSFQKLPLEGRKFKVGVNRMVLFTWSENKKAKYLFELATDPSFSNKVESRNLEVNYFRMRVTNRGTYYWKVRTDGDSGPIETRSFTIQ